LRETPTVKGHEVCCLKYSRCMKDMELVVYAYCFGGLAGTLRVRTCTTTATFDECEADVTELLNSLEIRRTAHPTLARMGQGLGFAALTTLGAAPVLGRGSLSFLDLYGLEDCSEYGGRPDRGGLFVWIRQVNFKLR
jgi:hypothetical protein